MKYASAYLAGAADALESFGIRLASDAMSRSMPDGPHHLGAEWLAKELRKDKEEYSGVIGSRSSHRKLEKPSTWGNPTSLEGSGSNSHNYSGMGQYGGV